MQTKILISILAGSRYALFVCGLVLTTTNASYAIDNDGLNLIQSPNKILVKLKGEVITHEDVPNPHWDDGACQACHTGKTGFTNEDLRTLDIDRMCGNCHNSYTKAAFIHPTGYEIPDKYWSEIPEVFRHSMETIVGNLSRKITCLSCHDLKIQCLKKNRKLKTINAKFFRLGPYQNRVELCFYCHDAGKFERFSPHKQIVRGKIDKQSCAICHLNTKKLTSKTRSSDIRLQSNEDINKLCINCHPWRPHPGWDVNAAKKKSTNHLTRPSKKMRNRMRLMKTKMRVDLPLGAESGKINCTTCHNPHQKGAIRSALKNAGADSKHRLRLKQSCVYCHDV